MSFETRMMSDDRIDVVGIIPLFIIRKRKCTPAYSKGTKVRVRHLSSDDI